MSDSALTAYFSNLIQTGGMAPSSSSSSSKDKNKKTPTPTTPTPQWTFQPSPYDQVPQYPSGADNPWLRVPGGAQDMPINMPPPPMPPAPPPTTPPANTPTSGSSQWGQMFEDLVGRVHSGETKIPRDYRTALQKLFPSIDWSRIS
jgi:hypothetical protein